MNYTRRMKFVTIHTIDTVVDHAVKALSSQLTSGERVVWLLSGGSAIELEVQISKALQAHDTSRLFIGLIDERYGAPGHEDENYSQLLQAGFPLPIQRVLIGETGEKTAELFGAHIEAALASASYALGVFGIGADGHTAGIKPDSPAATSSDPAVFFEWDDYQRITLTPPTIRRLDEAIIYARGSEKTETLQRLVQETLPIREHPAQVLKDIKTSTVYTDVVLDSAQ